MEDCSQPTLTYNPLMRMFDLPSMPSSVSMSGKVGKSEQIVISGVDLTHVEQSLDSHFLGLYIRIAFPSFSPHFQKKQGFTQGMMRV